MKARLIFFIIAVLVVAGILYIHFAYPVKTSLVEIPLRTLAGRIIP